MGWTNISPSEPAISSAWTAHDPGNYEEPLEPGEILTVEPGNIDEREEHHDPRRGHDSGHREGHTNLSADLPIEVADIEKLMSENDGLAGSHDNARDTMLTDARDRRIATHFPILEEKTYLYNCSQGALSDAVEAGMSAFATSWRTSSAPWDDWMGVYEALRGSVRAIHQRVTQ